MPLTDTAIRNTKPGDKSAKLFDGGGLYLEITPTGGKLWWLKYRLNGKEKRLTLGAYLITGLKEARAKATRRWSASRPGSRPCRCPRHPSAAACRPCA